jgi:hypothetical protein
MPAAFYPEQTDYIEKLNQLWELVQLGSGATAALPYFHVREEQPSGTVAGTSTAAEQARTLNTLVTNTIEGASLDTSTSTITLPAGTYYTVAGTPTVNNRHQTKLASVSGTATVLYGTPYAGLAGPGSTPNAFSVVRGVFTLTATTELKIYTKTTATGANLGSAASQYVEIYSEVEIWQIS